MNNDLYQNDGETYQNGVYYPEEDIERKEEEAKEVGVIASSYPIMDDIADWFRQQIIDCDSFDNIETKAMTINGVRVSRTVSIEAQVLAYQLLKEKLMDKFQEFDRFGKEIEP